MTNKEYEKLLATEIDEYAYASSLDTFDLLYVNEALCNHMGITEEDWKGKKCYEVMHLATNPCAFCTKDYIPLNETYSRYRHKRSKQLHLITKDKIIECSHGRVLIQTSYDVSNEFIKIKKLQSDLHLNQSIIACAKTSLNHGSTQVNISKLLKIIGDYFGAMRVSLYEYNSHENTINCNFQYLSNGTTSSDEINVIDVNPLENWWDILESNDIVYIPSIAEKFDENTPEFKHFSVNSVKSCIITSIKINNEVAGLVMVLDPTIVNESFDLLTTASLFISNNLEKNKTVCKLEHSVDSVGDKIDVNNILLECAEILFNETDISVTISKILETLLNYFDADRISLFEVDSEKDKLVNTYEVVNDGCHSLLESLKDTKVPIPNFLLDSMHTSPTFLIKADDTNFSEESEAYDIIKRFGIPSYMITSLVKKNEFAGLLSVHYPKQNEENQTLLHTISGFILNEISKRDIIKGLESLSFTDKLTGLFNRNFYLHAIEKYKITPTVGLGIIFADINGLKRANDNLGHEYGDGLIKWCGNFLAKHNPNCVYRIGGDEFVCFIEGMECGEFFDHIQKMRLELHNANLPNMSMGGTWSNGEQSVDDQIIETDKIMYLEKQKYYILKRMTQIKPEDELEVIRKLLEPTL